MTDHDPLCPESEPDPGDTVRQHGCLCYLIERTRADERERIAREIEDATRTPGWRGYEGVVLREAARTARGDSDE